MLYFSVVLVMACIFGRSFWCVIRQGGSRGRSCYGELIHIGASIVAKLLVRFATAIILVGALHT